MRQKGRVGLICVMAFMFGSGLLTGCGGGLFADKNKLEVEIQSYYTQTADGWNLQVQRYRPSTIEGGNNPVILCHGLSYNNRFWDLANKVSLARYLAGEGYDVWAVSLRGAGLSDQPLANVVRKIGTGALDPKFLTTAHERRLGRASFSEYSVDDHISYDVPAVIEFVKRKTGAKKVHWVGHSMGGMIMFAHLGMKAPEAGEDIDTFVAVSVPMVVPHPLSRAMQLQVDNAELLKAGNKVISTGYDALVAKVLGKLAPPTVSESLFLNRDNVEDSTLRLLAQRAQESISAGQLEQLLSMAAEENFHSLDGKVDYASLLGEVNVPSFFLVGQLDNMATVGAVKYAYKRVSSQEKGFRLFGRISGDRADYGHDDIIIGKRAKKEVYPEILKWLDAHRRMDAGTVLD